MTEQQFGENYKHAKAEADKIEAQIIDAVQKGYSFRVEAGAGSGKTYSLNQVIEWLQANKWHEFRQKKQNVACITFTNAAVDVIAARLANDSFIIPSTIHAFAWNSIKQYQEYLITIVTTDSNYVPDKGDFFEINEVKYTLGHRYKENGVYYLRHDDVLNLFCQLLDNNKFRQLFAKKYPIILIDEYQDSFKPIVDRFLLYFISPGTGPQFGFFGDAWQTIYQSNNACGNIEHDNLEVIKKGSNFRSAPRIVEILNRLRPDLPQTSAIDNNQGEVIVITCNDYTGDRRKERNFKDDLPLPELKERLDKVTQKVKKVSIPQESLKVLMITHKVLAAQQGYDKLMDVLKDELRDKQDHFLLFFMESVEPVYQALKGSDMQLLFDTLRLKRYPVIKKSDKMKWMILSQQLDEARQKKAIDVFDTVKQSGLIPIPPILNNWYQLYKDTPETIYSSDESIGSFLNIEYAQFIAAINFLYPKGVFSTEHGVKGEEYDNVIFVISKGWNQYQFEKYAPMITGHSPIPQDKQDTYERNRNLFYVCCSRPRKRLFFFVSLYVEPIFNAFLEDLVGKQNIYTYRQFLELYKPK